MIRATTNSVLLGYKNNLMSSFVTLNKAVDRVLTQRNFLSYAEDPAAAAQSFALRRSFARVNSQLDINISTARKFDVAWNSLDSMSKMLDTETTSNSAWKDVMSGLSDTSGAGRNPLGQSLQELAKNMVQTMNAKYGDHHVFSGADGENPPFTWGQNGELLYRGVNVDDPAARAQLQQLSEEGRYVDIGLGLKEDAAGNLIKSSAFNDALQGINFLGYGVDADGDPQNVISIVNRMGEILSNCDDEGTWASDAEAEEFRRLAGKFEGASANFKKNFVELDVRAEFLKNNELQLKSTAYTLNEQLVGIENCSPAEAISSLSWAQYSYNAALKVGNSILSQSLMDYMR